MTHHPVTVLFDIIEGPVRYALLDWALSSGLFELCQTPTAAAELAARLSADPDQLQLALRALTAMGLLQQQAEAYVLDAAYAPYLLSDGGLGPTLQGLAATRHRGLADFAALMQGRPQHPSQPLFDAAHWQRTAQSLQSFHQAVAAQEMLACLQSLPEWAGARQVLDVGGGSPVLAREICALRPDIRVTLFDLPGLIAAATPLTAGQDRIDLVAGSYNDPTTLPNDQFDIIWCSMSLYFHSDGLASLLARLSERLRPGGVLVSFHEALVQGRTAPREHVLGRLMPALNTGDLSFAADQVSAAMTQVGLAGVTSRPWQTPFGLYRMDCGRRR